MEEREKGKVELINLQERKVWKYGKSESRNGKKKKGNQ